MPGPSFYQRPIANFRPSNGGGAGVRRLFFTPSTTYDIENHYVVGANVGAQSIAVRRALMRRANNKADGKPCGSCPGPSSHIQLPLPVVQIPLQLTTQSSWISPPISGTTPFYTFELDELNEQQYYGAVWEAYQGILQYKDQLDKLLLLNPNKPLYLAFGAVNSTGNLLEDISSIMLQQWWRIPGDNGGFPGDPFQNGGEQYMATLVYRGTGGPDTDTNGFARNPNTGPALVTPTNGSNVYVTYIEVSSTEASNGAYITWDATFLDLDAVLNRLYTGNAYQPSAMAYMAAAGAKLYDYANIMSGPKITLSYTADSSISLTGRLFFIRPNFDQVVAAVVADGGTAQEAAAVAASIDALVMFKSDQGPQVTTATPVRMRVWNGSNEGELLVNEYLIVPSTGAGWRMSFDMIPSWKNAPGVYMLAFPTISPN